MRNTFAGESVYVVFENKTFTRLNQGTDCPLVAVELPRCMPWLVEGIMLHPGPAPQDSFLPVKVYIALVHLDEDAQAPLRAFEGRSLGQDNLHSFLEKTGAPGRRPVDGNGKRDYAYWNAATGRCQKVLRGNLR